MEEKSLERIYKIQRNDGLLFLNISVGVGIYFHLNFHLIGRTHSFLYSLSKLGFEKYQSYGGGNENAGADG